MSDLIYIAVPERLAYTKSWEDFCYNVYLYIGGKGQAPSEPAPIPFSKPNFIGQKSSLVQSIEQMQGPWQCHTS